jgi:hypothetical protein
LCTLLAVSACTSPPASAPAPAASNTASDLPVINTSISHEVPAALQHARFFDRPITDFDVTVVPSSTFERIKPDDPRLTSTQRPVIQSPWCSDLEDQLIGPDTDFALRTPGGSCDPDEPREPTPGVLDGDRFIPFTGYTPDPPQSPQSRIDVIPLSYTEDGVLLDYTNISGDSILWTELVYARADTMTMYKAVSFEDLTNIDPENYYINHTINLGGWVDNDTLILSTFMSAHAQNSEYGIGVISIGLDGTNPAVELFDAAPQRWTQRDEPLFATREEGQVTLLRRTGISQYNPVYTNTESSTYLPQRVEYNWAGMIDGQLLIAVDAGLILVDEQTQTITVIEMNSVPGSESGNYSPTPLLTDTHLLWNYVPYNSQYSGIYALNRETLAGVMTLVEGSPHDLRVASEKFTVDLYKFMYEVEGKYLETHISLP